MDKVTALNWMYNLILDKHVRTWERQLLQISKEQIEGGQSLARTLEELEFALRPLALRSNLTPKVAEFYQAISNQHLFGNGVGGMLPND